MNLNVSFKKNYKNETRQVVKLKNKCLKFWAHKTKFELKLHPHRDIIFKHNFLAECTLSFCKEN